MYISTCIANLVRNTGAAQCWHRAPPPSHLQDMLAAIGIDSIPTYKDPKRHNVNNRHKVSPSPPGRVTRVIPTYICTKTTGNIV